MPSRSLTIEQILTTHAGTPPRIAALTAGLATSQLHTTPNPDEWSANDVVLAENAHPFGIPSRLALEYAHS